jgi:hypothetical protein
VLLVTHFPLWVRDKCGCVSQYVQPIMGMDEEGKPMIVYPHDTHFNFYLGQMKKMCAAIHPHYLVFELV